MNNIALWLRVAARRPALAFRHSPLELAALAAAAGAVAIIDGRSVAVIDADKLNKFIRG